jgi:hypothetical protein
MPYDALAVKQWGEKVLNEISIVNVAPSPVRSSQSLLEVAPVARLRPRWNGSRRWCRSRRSSRRRRPTSAPRARASTARATRTRACACLLLEWFGRGSRRSPRPRVAAKRAAAVPRRAMSQRMRWSQYSRLPIAASSAASQPRNSSRSCVLAIMSADRIAESPADVHLDVIEVTADPDDGDAGHQTRTCMDSCRQIQVSLSVDLCEAGTEALGCNPRKRGAHGDPQLTVTRAASAASAGRSPPMMRSRSCLQPLGAWRRPWKDMTRPVVTTTSRGPHSRTCVTSPTIYVSGLNDSPEPLSDQQASSAHTTATYSPVPAPTRGCPSRAPLPSPTRTMRTTTSGTSSVRPARAVQPSRTSEETPLRPASSGGRAWARDPSHATRTYMDGHGGWYGVACVCETR